MHAESRQSLHLVSTAQFGLCGKVFLGRILEQRDFEAHCREIVDCLRISRQKTIFGIAAQGRGKSGRQVRRIPARAGQSPTLTQLPHCL